MLEVRSKEPGLVSSSPACLEEEFAQHQRVASSVSGRVPSSGCQSILCYCKKQFCFVFLGSEFGRKGGSKNENLPCMAFRCVCLRFLGFQLCPCQYENKEQEQQPESLYKVQCSIAYLYSVLGTNSAYSSLFRVYQKV